MEKLANELLKTEIGCPVHYFLKVYYYDEVFTPIDCIFSEDCICLRSRLDDPIYLYFSNLRRLLLDQNSYFLVKLEFKDEIRDGEDYLYMAVYNRVDFTNKLGISFRCFYLNRELKDKKLPIFRAKLENRVRNYMPQDLFKLPVVIKHRELKYIKALVQGYSFFLPDDYKASEYSENIFLRYDDASGGEKPDFVSFQVSRNIPLNQLQFFGKKVNVEYYAEEIMQSWLKSSKTRLFVIESSRYCKRLNLNNDKSKWVGHLIVIKGEEGAIYIVGVLRRLFIAPMLDTFDDFVIMMQYHSEEARQPHIIDVSQEDEDPESQAHIRPVEIFKLMMDSVQCENMDDCLYLQQIQERIEYLGLTFEEYKFLEHTYDITPQSDIIRGETIKLMVFILQCLYSGLESVKSQEYNILNENLHKREKLGYDEQERDHIQSSSGLSYLSKLISNLRKYISQSGTAGMQGGGQQAKSNWVIKCLDYFVYCIHGGYFPSRLTLEDLMITNNDTVTLHDKTAVKMKQILIVLLRFLGEDENIFDIVNREPETLTLFGIVQNFVDNHEKILYTWNDHVLHVMLRTRFLYDELARDPLLFIKFINCMLQSGYVSIETKKAVLQSILKLFEDKAEKDYKSEMEKNRTYLIVITNLLKTEKNSELRILALNVLIGICHKSEKLQFFLVKQGEIVDIIEKIFSKEIGSELMRLACIHLMCKLCENKQNHDVIIEKLLDYVIQIFHEIIARIKKVNPIALTMLIDLSILLSIHATFCARFHVEQIMQSLMKMRFYLGIPDPDNRLKINIHSLFKKFYSSKDEESQSFTADMGEFLLESFRHICSQPEIRGVKNLVRAVFRSMSKYKDNEQFKETFVGGRTEELFDHLIRECEGENSKLASKFKKKIFDERSRSVSALGR